MNRAGLWVRQRWLRVALFLSVMGPGIITGNVDNDANGIATYSIAGASFGYRLLWTLFLSTISLAVVQEMVARMGAVTGKGLADLIRERFRVRLTVVAMLIFTVADWGNTVGNFAGMAGAAEIFGISRYVVVPVAAVFVWMVVVRGSYRLVERIFFGALLIYLTYAASAVLAKPPWGEVLRATFTPSFQLDAPYLAMVIGVVGTTITPWMQFYQQASVVDKGIRAEDLGSVRVDTYLGMITTNLIAAFIIVACGATLFVHGITISDAKDAALALTPLAGRYAAGLFAVGLLNASLASVAIIPLSTAYTLCEAFGWEAGLDRSFREAPAFFGVFSVQMAAAALVILIPGIPLIPVMFLSQMMNGILLPILLIITLILANDRGIMGSFKNSLPLNIIAGLTVAAMILLTLLLLIMTVRAAA